MSRNKEGTRATYLATQLGNMSITKKPPKAKPETHFNPDIKIKQEPTEGEI